MFDLLKSNDATITKNIKEDLQVARKASPWNVNNTLELLEAYKLNKDINSLAEQFDVRPIQILRKLVAERVYVKSKAKSSCVNKQILANDLNRLLGLNIRSFQKMTKQDLVLLREALTS